MLEQAKLSFTRMTLNPQACCISCAYHDNHARIMLATYQGTHAATRTVGFKPTTVRMLVLLTIAMSPSSSTVTSFCDVACKFSVVASRDGSIQLKTSQNPVSDEMAKHLTVWETAKTGGAAQFRLPRISN